MEQSTKNPENNFQNWLQNSLTAKMLIVGILILVLLIPLSFVQNLIQERANRQKEVISEINDKWGKENSFSGPLLKIPYVQKNEVKFRDPDTKEIKSRIETSISHIFVSPDEFQGKAQIEAKELKRSIYKTAVYEGTLLVNGTLAEPDLSSLNISSESILWDKVSILIQTSNLKGIRNNLILKMGENSFTLSPQSNQKSNPEEFQFHELETEKFDFRNLTTKKFQLDIKFNGSESFNLIPLAKNTQLNVQSNWTSPSFTGAFLPKNETDKISKGGFNANWEILYYNRPFSQVFLDKIPHLNEYSFGVNLIVPVDEYQKSERSAKYGYLVISFTFLFFFLLQTITKIPIHAFQYFLIGLALVMFYTLLISISEHSNFLKAYFIAGASVIGLISLYSVSVLKKSKFALWVALSLSALYAFIYVIIQLESYALLAGSIGLFVILAIVMYVSRKIEWK
jgi:inner membrane protein